MQQTPARKASMPENVDAYFAALSPEQHKALGELRRAILSVVPGAAEAISYRMPMVKYKGKYLVGYAAFQKHCSLFALGYATIKAYRAALKDYATAKGTIRFPSDQPIPVALVRKLVRARKAEVDAGAAKAAKGSAA